MNFRVSKSKNKRREKPTNRMVIAGMDEVGRGPLAGPLVACVFIKEKKINSKIDDSKKLTEAQRNIANEELLKCGQYGIGTVTSEEIDKIGLARANRLVFKRAIDNLPIKPDLILIDGNIKLKKSECGGIPYQSLVKGDQIVEEISCASIIAKVFRDKLMRDNAEKYKNYEFEKNVGYGTSEHLKALKRFGPCPIHRKSFEPLKSSLSEKKDAKGQGV